MAELEPHEDVAKVASHTLAYLRSLEPKMDLVLETRLATPSVWDVWSGTSLKCAGT